LKRLLAILLLLALGLPGALPLLALSNSTNGKLPSCCRRNGAHHCTSPDPFSSSSDSVTLSANPSRCPLYPSALPAGQQIPLAFETFATFETALAACSSADLSSLSSPSNAFSFNRPTRGPPAVTLYLL
jgi:hypothetical protein